MILYLVIWYLVYSQKKNDFEKNLNGTDLVTSHFEQLRHTIVTI